MGGLGSPGPKLRKRWSSITPGPAMGIAIALSVCIAIAMGVGMGIGIAVAMGMATDLKIPVGNRRQLVREKQHPTWPCQTLRARIDRISHAFSSLNTVFNILP